MDDEIDIEEHDILEHPQVKAVFPDLSKLQIQVHASGAAFLNETLVHSDEFENLPEVTQSYPDNDFEEGIPEDLSKTVQEEHELQVPYLEECSEEKDGWEEDLSEQKDFVEEAHVISDSEYNDDAVPTVPPILINGNVDSSEVIRLDNKVDVLDLSEDELIEPHYHAASKLVEEITLNKHSNIGGCNILLRKLVENIYEISDDEIQSQELEGKSEIAPYVLTKKTPNDAEFMETPINGDQLKGDLDNGDGSIEDGLKNCEFIEEGVELTNEDQADETEELNHNVDDDEQHTHAIDQDEFQPIRIKDEIEDEESMTGYDETPIESFNNEELQKKTEDIYHFNNKIILGSKPSPHDKYSSLAKSYLVVLLEDWNVHLTRSQSYCDACGTLFTTPNALDSHRMSTHSLLAPITNRALKSTTKSSLTITRSNIAKKSTAGYDISNSTHCNHCNVTFKDHTTFIKHLYKLLPGKQYGCNVCKATFQSQNDLVNHNISVHVKVQPRKILKAKNSYESNSILKKLLNNGMMAMNTKALKRSHPAEKLTPVKVKKEVVYDKWWASRFKCLVCNVILETYTLARKHRRSEHPEVLALEKMFHRLPSNNQHNSKDKLKYVGDASSPALAEDMKVEKTFELIPKSALFQCSKCSVHFTSSVAGASHFSGNRCSDNVCWSCPICKKRFRKRDELCHTKQHKLSSKFKVYKITKNTYERTLCKCLQCGVHFEYILLKAHIAKCGKIPTAKCQKCNIIISKYKLAEHTKRHDVMKLKPKDFVFVDYAVINDKSKSKTVAHMKTTDKTNKKDDSLNLSEIKQDADITESPLQSETVNKLKYEQEKVKLYYCKRCKSFLSRKAKSHFTKQCVGRYKLTWNCTLCGLQLFLKYRNSHKRLHEDTNFTLKDIEFLDLATLKPIKPPIPKYPSCSKCQIHFLDAKMIDDHICGEDYENCEVCGDKFENSTLDLHLPFHEMHAERSPIPKPRMIPELMMKYESLNAIWNILFICGKCNLVTDLYNNAVEHSQAHLNKESSQPNTIKCYICNLKFDESCWSKHSELHSRMSINSKDFKILEYTPKNLLDESWFQMFESLPEKEIRQIIDRSVFGSERSLKMRLVKDGLPEFTLYCCSVCQVSYDNSDILSHVNDKCRATKHACRECEVVFDTQSTLNLHALLHRKGIKKEEFRIVNFVKDTPKKANVKDKVKAKAKKVAKSKKPAVKVKKANGVSKFVLYKCVECSACVQISHSRGYHTCAPEHHLIYCKICKQNFSFRQMKVHREKHQTQRDFKARNIKIVDFEPIPAGKDKPIKIRKYKKRKPKSSLANSISSDARSEIEPRSRSKRGSSVYGFESLANLVTSDAKPKTRKTINSSKRSISLETSVTEDRVAKVYKCDCGLHYTSLKTIEKHLAVCDNGNDISKENCSKCGLMFPTDVLVSHLCKHHSANTKVTVEEIHKRSNVTEATSQDKIKPVKDSIKLYKCSDCNVYFLNQNSCYKHTYRHEQLDPKQYIECKMCHLQFRILSLHIHMKRHHDTEFNLEKVIVEEYHPRVGKQASRIDTYYASDRFQNVQVSSSND